MSIFATDEVKEKFLGDNKLAFDIHMNEIVDDPKHFQDAFNAVCKIAAAVFKSILDKLHFYLVIS